MRVGRWALAICLLQGVVACGNREPIDPCKINPTVQAADGHWVEADGEELDDDPCDSDDLDEDGYEHNKVKKPSTKPKVSTGTRK